MCTLEKSGEQEKTAPTLADLEKARQELEYWQERFGKDSSSNPDKYSSQIRDAAIRVRDIKTALKKAGVIEMTPEEKLTAKLDELYPNARSRTVVEYEGQKYEIIYFPLETSRSGKTVHEWGHKWRPFKEKEPKKSRRPRK